MANLDGQVVSLRSSHARTGSADTPVPDGTRPRAWRRRRRLRVVLCESELDAQADRCDSREAIARGYTGLGCYSSKAEVLSRWVARRNASAPSGAAARPRRGVMKQ